MKYIAALLMMICFVTGCATPHQKRTDTDTEPVTLANIVTDIAKNGTRSKYKGQNVTMTAAGRVYPGFNENPTLELFTHHDNVRFFITDSDTDAPHDHYYLNYRQSRLAHIRGHTVYTFTLRIKNISEDSTVHGDPFFTIWADPPEHTEKADIDIPHTTIQQIASSGQKYTGKTVRIEATLALNQLNGLLGVADDIDPELLKTYAGAMTLATHNKNITFWIIDDIAGDDTIPSNLQEYRNHQTYTFTLYIERIVTEGEQVEITTGIADD